MTSQVDFTKQLEIIRSTIRNAISEAIVMHAKVETLSNVVDWRLNAKDERELFEEMFDGYDQILTSHLIQLKIRRNQLAAINKLPIEVFRSIISLIDLPKNRVQNAYLSYTWVCRRWRSALIEDPNFWTSFHLRLIIKPNQRVLNPFIQEYLRRSNSANLDFTLTIRNINLDLTSKLEEDVIAKNSHRIRNFWLNINQSSIIKPLFLNKDFSSLRALNYSGGSVGFAALLPVLVALDRLRVLQCTLGTNFPTSTNEMNNLATVLGRIRHLSLDIHTRGLFQFVLESIHNSENLTGLKLIEQDMDDIAGPALYPPQTILPELLFLSVNNSSVLENFQTPKLSALHVECSVFVLFMEYPIFKDINFSSVKYLYLLDTTNRRGLHSIVGLDECLYDGGSLFTTKPSGFTKDKLLLEDFEASFDLKDIVNDGFPMDYFNFTFSSDEISDRVLELAFSAILPRLPNLKELYLLSFNLTREVNTPLDGILTNIPNVEKLVIQNGGELKDFILLLTDSFVCPRLKYLAYTMMFWPGKEDLDIKRYAEDIGKALIECVQSRYKIHGDILKFVALGNCPALPDSCLEELKSLGTAVVTEKSR